MRIAFLMQCHKCPQQINLLTKTLLFDDNDIFIHIDKKSNIESDIVQTEHIHVLSEENRIDVKWGQISQVDATLRLINEVIQSNVEYDYIYLISGQDFPVKPSTYIIEFLEQNKGKAFMDIMDIKSKRYKRFLKRNEVYTAQKTINKSFSMRVLRNIWYLLTGGRYKTFKLFKRKYEDDVFYFGSSWWCLPYDAVRQMMSYLLQHPQYYYFYSHCHCPDESFFQTLLMNHTAYFDNVVPSLTYVHWGDDNNSPKTFTSSDEDMLFDIIEKKEFLLARKFDMTVDSDIIENNLLNIK